MNIFGQSQTDACVSRCSHRGDLKMIFSGSGIRHATTLGFSPFEKYGLRILREIREIIKSRGPTLGAVAGLLTQHPYNAKGDAPKKSRLLLVMIIQNKDIWKQTKRAFWGVLTKQVTQKAGLKALLVEDLGSNQASVKLKGYSTLRRMRDR